MKRLKYISLLVFLIASSCLEDCWAVDTISITHPIQDPDSIVSSGQTFKLGFFSPENTRDRYVGIMYNVPGHTVVWVANRDRPLNDSSGIFTISGDGNLVVLNGQKEILWSSNLQNPVANSSAQLRDVGDLVLKDNSGGTVLWESFENPTDSFLRTMMIGVTKNKTIQLSSWRSPSDPSIGSFTLGIDPLRSECIVWNRSKLHWRSGPWNGSIFIGVDGMDFVYRNRFNLVSDNSGTAYCTYDFENTSSLLHYELTSWGDVQERVYYGNGDWNVTFSCVRSECDVYGKCGPFGICDPRSSPICTCLRGFEPRDKEGWSKGNWTGGCFRRALLQCERNGSAAEQGKGDGFLRLTMIKVPDLSFYVALPNEECTNACLNNCSCTAYSFVMGIGCLHWSGNLLDVQQFSSTGMDIYVRAAYSELDHAISKRIKIAIIATTVTVGSLFLAVSLYFLWKWFIKHRGNNQEAELSLIEAAEVGKGDIMLNDNTENSKLEDLPIYSYKTLANATDNFHIKNVLGKGGFGPVYKGKLKDGPEVAVKRLSNSSSQGIKEFMNEVMVISKLQHRNLVRLLGCCVEREEKMLVYEYMPNKSLDAYIFDSQKQDLLDWNRRVVIIEGIGRGLLYLHRDSRLRIIHRDLKASNILLDEELHPKISDFGLARIFGGKQDQANTSRVVGTYGYMAPEYAMGGKFSEKSDVYSFGVLLLEIVSGKRNTSFYHAEEGLSLVGYAWKLWNEKETLKLVDTAIFDPSIETEILRCVHVGLLCIQESEKDRPSVSTALLMLNSEFGELPRVKLPAYTARLALSENENSPATGNSVNDVSLTDVYGR